MCLAWLLALRGPWAGSADSKEQKTGGSTGATPPMRAAGVGRPGGAASK